MLLSAILPIYNVENYIRPCIESIYRQGLDENDFEIILVNDGTKDNSMGVISDIISQHSNIIVLNQENQGISIARNNGLVHAQGKYVVFIDSDDLLLDNTLLPLLNKAQAHDSDLTIGDFLELHDEEISNLQFSSPKELIAQEKTGNELLLELNPHHCYIWKIIYKREFLSKNNIWFIPGIYYEDVPFAHECYIKANKCQIATWPFYIYRKGHESTTFSFSEKKGKDFSISIAKTWELTTIDGLPSAVRQKIENDVFTSFSVLISTISHCTKNLKERICIVDFLWRETRNIHFRNGKKQKIINFIFKKMPHTYIHIHHLYGKIFEDNLMPYYRRLKHCMHSPNLS